MAQTIKLKRSGTSGAIPTTSQLELGEVAINTYDGKMYIKKSVSGTESIVEISAGNTAADAILVEYQFTASANQTTFTGSDDNSETLSYTPGAVQVFLNGILLDSGVDFTASNGTSIVLSETVDSNDYLQVLAFKKKISDGSVSVDTFTGNGSTTAFTLSVDPGDENNTRAYIDGVYQSKSNYAVSGTTLTFSTAPPTGTAIEVEIGNRNVTLDTTANLDFPDNVQLRLGTDQDLKLYHTGSHGILTNSTGDIRYQSNTRHVFSDVGFNETHAIFNDNGAVTLYHDNSPRFATNSSGVTITGELDVGTITSTGNLSLNQDNGTAYFGADADLRIFHDGTNSYIVNQTNDLLLDLAGDIVIDADGGDFIFRDGGTNRMTMKVNDGPNVDFIAQTSDHDIRFRGVDGSSTITALRLDMSDSGGAYFNNDIYISDSQAVRFGTDQDFRISSDGSSTYLVNSVLNQDIYVQGRDSSGLYNMLTMDMSARKSTFAGIVSNPTGFEVGNMFIMPNEIDVSSGDLTLDVAGDIILDAADNDIILKDNGTTFGQLTNDSGNLIIYNSGSQMLKGLSTGPNAEFIGTVKIPKLGINASANSNYSLYTLQNGSITHAAYLQVNGGTATGLEINASASSAYSGDVLYARQSSRNTGGNLARFANSDGDKFVVQTNGYVGIGVSNPDQPLIVKGAIETQATNSTNGWMMYTYTDNTYRINYNGAGADEIIINTSGHVGIGSSPSYLLHVDAQVSTDPSYIVASSGSNFIVGMGSQNSPGVGQEAFVGTLSNDDLKIKSNNTERIRIKAAGNVGIGDTDPDSKLVVNGGRASEGVTAGGTYTELTRTSGGDLGLLFNKDTSKWLIGIDNSDGNAGPLRFMYGAYNASVHPGFGTDYSGLNLAYNGHVGIGTKTPNSSFHVQENTSVVYDATAYQHDIFLEKRNSAGANQTTGIRFAVTGYDGSTTAEASIGILQTSNAHSGNLVFGTRHSGTRAERMRITSDGKVGIGITSPYFPLHVQGANLANGAAKTTALFFDTTSAAAGTGGGIALGGYTNGTGGDLYHFGNIQGIKENSTAGNYDSAMIFSTRVNGATPTEKLRISSVGNVHLNSGLDARIQLSTSGTGANSVSENSVYIRGNDDDLLLNAAGNGKIVFTENTHELMRMEPSGDWMVGNTVARVASHYNNQAGIGWREADHHFEVATTYDRSAAEFGRNHANSGDVITIRQQGTSVGMIGTEGGDSLVIQSNGSTGVGLRFHPSTTNIDPVRQGARINNVVSLGSTTHRFKDLHLSNSIDISKTTTGNITGGTANQGAVLTLHHEAQWENGYTGGDFLGALNFSTGDASSGEGVRAAIKTSVDTYYNTNKLRFYVAPSNNTSLTERMQINHNGFVGIGSTNPLYSLHLSSTLYVENDGSTGYTHSRLITQSNNSSRGSGLFMHNDSSDTEWYAGRPYNSSDTFVVNRNATASHDDATADSSKALFRIFNDGSTHINARGLNTVSHNFAYNESGGEIDLYNSAGSIGTLIDDSNGDSRFLQLVDGGHAVVGLGSSNTTGSIIFMKAGYTEAMRVDSSGRVSKNLQTGFLARGNTSQWLNTQGGAWQVLKTGAAHGSGGYLGVNLVETSSGVWNGYDNGSCFDPTNGRFTAPIAGKYLLTGSAYCNKNTGSSTGYMHFNLWVNGTNLTPTYNIGGHQHDFNHDFHLVISQQVYLDANDYVEWRIYSNNTNMRVYGDYVSISAILLA